MSSLVNRIQDAILGGAGAEKVRALLAELQIPAGRTPVPGALERIRQALFYSGASEQELRDAFADLGLTGGGGGGAQALSDIRRALLHNF